MTVRLSSVAAFLVCIVSIGCNAGTVDRLPTDAKSLFERAQILIERGDHESAVDALTRAIALKNDDPRFYVDRGVAFEQLGKLAEAEADYTNAIQVDDTYAPAYNDRAALRARDGRFDEANEDLSAAIRLDPNNLLAYQNRALARYDIGEYAAALEDVRMAERIEPNNPVNIYRRGQNERALGRAEDAIASLTVALALGDERGIADADRALITAERARAYEDLGRFEEAVADFEVAAQLNPGLGVHADAESLMALSIIQNGLRQAGFEISNTTPAEGFDLSASIAGVSRPVLIAEPLNDDEFQLTDVQAQLLTQNPTALVAVVNPGDDAASVVPASELAQGQFRAVAFAVRRPDVAPLPE